MKLGVIKDLAPFDKNLIPDKTTKPILPVSSVPQPTQTFVVSVDEVEQKTGLDFFSLLPKEQQEALESNITIDAWKWQ